MKPKLLTSQDYDLIEETSSFITQSKLPLFSTQDHATQLSSTLELKNRYRSKKNLRNSKLNNSYDE